jgi:hypothetical protein
MEKISGVNCFAEMLWEFFSHGLNTGFFDTNFTN